MIYISLGSNLGNRIQNLRKAFELLSSTYLQNATYSVILETEAIAPPDSPSSWNKPFLNMVVKGETELSPELFLKSMKEIEIEMGRPIFYDKWSPRIIDIDILFWDNIKINTEFLTIPHAQIKNRPFFIHLLALMGVSEYKTSHYTNNFIKSCILYPKFVGIVNITNDSFSDGGKFNRTDRALKQILKLVSDGASIIELGAQSTRPGAELISEEEEFNQLKSLLNLILNRITDLKIEISLDSFNSNTVYKLLNLYPISLVNDVKGDLDEKTIELIIDRGCKLCIMHSLSIPSDPNITIPKDSNTIEVIKKWGADKINKLLDMGMEHTDIIIDPGIGFGKSIYQNIDIIKNIDQLKTLNTKILVGHSRKGFINAFSLQEPADRDLETIAISSRLINKVDFLRVHNVASHMRFLSVYENIV